MRARDALSGLDPGGTTFTFGRDRDQKIQLDQPGRAAGGMDVLLGGGANVVQQYLAAGLVDEFELPRRSVPSGGWRAAAENVGSLKLEQVRAIGAPGVTHIKYRVVR